MFGEKRGAVFVIVFLGIFLISLSFVSAIGELDGKLAGVPEAGPAVCAFHCNEDLQRCAPGCPCRYTKSDGTCGTREEANQELENQESEYGVVGPERSFDSTEAKEVYEDTLKNGNAATLYSKLLSERRDKLDWQYIACNDPYLESCRRATDNYYELCGAPGHEAEKAAGEQREKECASKVTADFTAFENAIKDAYNLGLEDYRTLQSQQQAKALAQQQNYNQQDTQESGTGTQSLNQNAKEMLTKFNNLDYSSVFASVNTITDFDGREMASEKIMQGLSKDLPYVKFDVPIQNVNAGNSVKINPSGDFPVSEVILIAGKTISDSAIVIEGTVPKLLRGEAKKLPVDDLPSPKGNPLYYISINDRDLSLGDNQQNPYTEAMFKWKVKAEKVTKQVNYDDVAAMDSSYYPLNVRYKMLHYSSNGWETLPTVLDFCDSAGYCIYITDSSVGGHYVIVEEKIYSDSAKFVVYIIIFVLLASMVGFYYLTERFKIKTRWKYLYYVVIALLAIIMAVGLLNFKSESGSSQQSQSDQQLTEQVLSSYDIFAKCLSDKGVKLYTFSGSVYCIKQNEIFYGNIQYLPSIECSDPNKVQADVCADADILGYPTWVFKDGSQKGGVLTISELSAKTGCNL
jgi:Tfp pilus assembly protein PilV